MIASFVSIGQCGHLHMYTGGQDPWRHTLGKHCYSPQKDYCSWSSPMSWWPTADYISGYTYVRMYVQNAWFINLACCKPCVLQSVSIPVITCTHTHIHTHTHTCIHTHTHMQTHMHTTNTHAHTHTHTHTTINSLLYSLISVHCLLCGLQKPKYTAWYMWVILYCLSMCRGFTCYLWG